MGLSSSRPAPTQILMVGLDAAGKTTILYKWGLGEVVFTIPTIGFNVEEVKSKKLELTVWDVGGKDKIRPLWRHYYRNMNAVIFVIDSNDRDRILDAREELSRMLMEDELMGLPLLILANKQDVPGAMTTNDITDRMGLNGLTDRDWYIQASCATTGDGLFEGLDWVMQAATSTSTETRREPRVGMGPNPGSYLVEASELEVWEGGNRNPSSSANRSRREDFYKVEKPYNSKVWHLPRGTTIEVVEVLDFRWCLRGAYGRIEEPYHGWFVLDERVRRPDVIVNLSEEQQAGGKTVIACNSLAGNCLTEFELHTPQEQTLGELRLHLMSTLCATREQLKLMRSDAALLSNSSDSALIIDALHNEVLQQQ